ncbi:MAG: glycosyltransferase family 39 protein [Chloroflexi bacterium]|nr:glycosyltransferase family 39 protein [Chloroflexota bacterium]
MMTLYRLPRWLPSIQRERSPAARDSKIAPAAISAILVAASILRLYGLDGGLWYDEIWTYLRYAKLPFWEIITTYDSQNQHFLYSLLAHASLAIFGDSAWSLRLPAVLFGVASIWALYVLRREVGSAREALLSAAVLASSYHHIWFSQNARGYTGLLFWTILSSWLLLRALREARPRSWLHYAIAGSLGVYTHVTMLFIIAGQFLVYSDALVARRHELWQARWTGLLGFGLAAFLTLLLHAPVLPQILSLYAPMLAEPLSVSTQDRVGPPPAWNHPLWTLLEFARGMEIGLASGPVALASLLVLGAGLVGFARTNLAVIHLLIAPVAICAAVNLAFGHPLYPRFFFFATGFAVLIVVRGAMLLGHAGGRLVRLPAARSAMIGPALVGAMILVSLPSLRFVYGPKQDYAGAYAFVEASREPDDAVVAVGAAAFPFRSLYGAEWEMVRSVESLDAIRSNARRTWLLYTLPIALQAARPELMATIHQDFKVVKEFGGTLGGGTIFVCVSDVLLSPVSAGPSDVALAAGPSPPSLLSEWQ